MVHRPVKLPSHLYLSPPSPPNAASSFASPTSAIFFWSPLTHASPGVLFNETSSSAIAATHRIPGFKTSASFLNSLRSNIHLATSIDPFPPSPSLSSSTTHLPIFPSTNPDSLSCTQDGLRHSKSHSPMPSPDRSLSPSPLPLSPTAPPPSPTPDTNPLANVPPPTTTHATTADDETAALKLIADSVAQQRQLATTSLICHPLILALYVAILAILTKLFYKGRSADLAIVLTTGAAVTVTGLIGIRWAVGGYLVRAEEVGTWDWLDEGKGRDCGRWQEDEVLVTRVGEEVIGALVIRGVRDSEPGGGGGRNHAKKRQRSNSSAGGNGSSRTKGVIRAWTVRQKYRREGVGGALLEEAVCWCRERGWNGPVFADDHANSGRVMPGMFNSGFEEREKRARRMLEGHIEDANAVVGNGKGGKARR